MAQSSRGGLFRPRNIIGTALIAGVGLGIYLGPLFKGWGLGGGTSLGTGGRDTNLQTTSGNDSDSCSTTPHEPPDDLSSEADASAVPAVVKVLINDRSFYLRQASEDTPIELSNLIKLVSKASGDPDGFKIRIYEKANARASAEEALKDALSSAEIPDTVIFWVPIPVK